ncbi:universal stress protein [Flavobacterium sp. NKUCC04_CG]|uniref:universal stress protein n=1 Tax=Flavobacterium sp. NKUCC04_CG TaxID=2842121 RepID=UPI002104ABDD|nr:universal stress protein [Flavobacterium sp. NKUCC04_CG]
MTIDKNKKLNLLIGLDLSSMDSFLIEYVKILYKILTVDKVVFIHNLKMGELPKDFLTPQNTDRITNQISKRLQDQIQNTEPEYEFEIRVKMENYSELAFMNLFKSEHFDLLVLGNKQSFVGNGGLAQKLIRVFPSAILMVPETYRSPLTTIIDAIDFSKYTTSIMNWADRFTNNAKGQKINHKAVYISKFNWAFLPTITAKGIKEATDLDIAKRKNDWDKKYANYSDIEIIAAGEKSVPTSLLEQSERLNANIMILGVKGRTGFKDLFLGSVANDIIQRSTNTALLFVK